MGGDAPAAYVELTGRVAWVGMSKVIDARGGTPVPGSKAGGPVGAGSVVVVLDAEETVGVPELDAEEAVGVPELDAEEAVGVVADAMSCRLAIM
jgi:hypothetical protein